MFLDGYVVGITGRRLPLLESLAQELCTSEVNSTCFTAQFDLTNVIETKREFSALLERMKRVDIVIISSGVGSTDTAHLLDDELATIAVNVAGFTTISNLAYHYFCQQGVGHLVGISSVAAIRGGPFASYNASKAYMSSYLEGLSCRASLGNPNIVISDIRPGFVDTAMAKGEGLFWVASADTAAQQIYSSILAKHRVAYVTRRWRLVAILLRLLPTILYKKLT